MPRLFIFAIGGTGERVMRSVTMLMAAGVPAFDNYEIYPIIIDYDEKNADKNRCVKLLMDYKKIHNAAFKRHTASSDDKGMKNQFFAAYVRDLTHTGDGTGNFTFPFKPSVPNMKFRDYIGYDEISGELMLSHELLQSLYDESNHPDTELNLDMTVGFKGNPNIGSVVFHDLASHSTFKKFISLYKPSNKDKVIIIGSIFGGTGASGIPEIANAINKSYPDADIATLLVLPYFAPAEKEGGAIKASRFYSKTKAALSFYESSTIKKKFNKIYYVGDFNPTTVAYSEGGKDQQNNANVVELIAGLMVEHYISDRGIGDTGKDYKFSIDADIHSRNGNKGGERLFLSNFDNISMDKALHYLVKLGLALKFIHDDVKGSYSKLKDRGFADLLKLKEAVNGNDTQLSVLISSLNDFYESYKKWMAELDYPGNDKELPPNSHRLGICDLTRDYASIVVKETSTGTDQPQQSFIDQVSSLWGSKPKKASADLIIARMENACKDNGESGHFEAKGSKLRAGHEEEWVFMDLLHNGIVQSYDETMKLS